MEAKLRQLQAAQDSSEVARLAEFLTFASAELHKRLQQVGDSDDANSWIASIDA